MVSKGKAAISAVALILVVGVAIAVVAVVRHNDNDDDKSTTSPQMKLLTAICSKTDYQDMCQTSLSPAAQNGSTDPKQFIKSAVQATINEVAKAFNFSSNLVVDKNTIPAVKMGVSDCKDLLQYAIDELQDSFSTVGDGDMHSINDRSADLKNWLSAVISYQQTCLDGVQASPELFNPIKDNLQNATFLTSNALAIVSTIGDILKSLNLGFNIKPKTRRLLELDHEGYPTWFSASDKRLLAAQAVGNVKPNAVVAKDGSGTHKTIASALAAYPKNHKGRYIIYIKAGVYDEYITVEKAQKNVFMYGDGSRRTMVTGKKSNAGGWSTFKSASFSAVGEGFIAKSMGFQNTAGPDGHQAVALRVQSDMSAFFNCRMDGYQDTLYVQTHRQFYRNCVISGTVDFIFGDSSTVIQNSLIIARMPNENQQNTVTAHGRADKRETTGLVIHNCRIVPEKKLFARRFEIPTYLGRPWKEYALTVIMETTLADFIVPAGYMPWAGDFALATCSYFEYGNRGPGAATQKRVKWKGVRVISKKEALQYTPGTFLQGATWIKAAQVPVILGLKNG